MPAVGPQSLWLVRHGESAGNVARDLAEQQGLHIIELTGRDVDVPLSALGERQSRALGRWIDRRGSPTPVSAELAAQMTRIEQAVDTMSVEVERISEAQRFQAKLLSDREKVRA